MLTDCRGEDSECRAPNGKVRDRHKRSIMAEEQVRGLCSVQLPHFVYSAIFYESSQP